MSTARILRGGRIRFLMLSRGRNAAMYRKSLRNQLPGSKIALNAPGAPDSRKLV